MSHDDPFSRTFPQHVDEIRARRERDPAFDEICSDFEDLHRRVPPVAHAHSDTLASLDALAREIRRWLGSDIPNQRGPQ